MKITLIEIPVKDVVEGYRNSNEEGVIGYDGKLNIRPKYQREFVYKDKQRDAVIGTLRKDFPLNVMYWAANGDGSSEVIDGQQRTISICEYVAGNFSIGEMYFHNLPKDQQEQILQYKLMVYFCEGTDSEKLDWFETINIAGEKLTEQELRNAAYTGPWLSDAKRYFSRTGCAAYGLASSYLTGVAIRQEYLETAINWISGGNIAQYMSKHQQDANANELWLHFQAVISWVKVVFPTYRKEMKGVDWGALYRLHGKDTFDSKLLETKVSELMRDEDATKKSGIYAYLVTGEEKHLSIRAFTDNMKREAFEKQKGTCPRCGDGKIYKIEEMEADHIEPWHAGGKTIAENCKMLCKRHNREKGGI
jgi:hypothetical protein